MEDDYKNLLEQASQVSLDSLAESLAAEENPPTHHYVRLSGLEEPDLSQFANIFRSLSEARRLNLLENLEDLATVNSLVSFDSVCKLGLDDPSPFIRQVAIRALWECTDLSLIPQFLDLLNNDDNEDVRAHAADGLGNFIYLGELEELTRQHLDRIVSVLIGIYKDSGNPIVLRRKALESLGYSSDTNVPSLIQESFQQENDDWISSSLLAMGRSADERWEPQTLASLDHPNNEVRLMAARAAGELAFEEATQPLLHLLEDEDEEVRMAAIWSLSEIGGKDVRNALQEMLEEEINPAESELIEEALENLAFNEDLADFNLFDFDGNLDIDELN